jgi:hypothetical protein
LTTTYGTAGGIFRRKIFHQWIAATGGQPLEPMASHLEIATFQPMVSELRNFDTTSDNSVKSTKVTINTESGKVLIFHGLVKLRLKAASAGNWVEIGERQQTLYHLMCINVMTSLAEARRISTCGPHISDSPSYPTGHKNIPCYYGLEVDHKLNNRVYTIRACGRMSTQVD